MFWTRWITLSNLASESALHFKRSTTLKWYLTWFELRFYRQQSMWRHNQHIRSRHNQSIRITSQSSFRLLLRNRKTIEDFSFHTDQMLIVAYKNLYILKLSVIQLRSISNKMSRGVRDNAKLLMQSTSIALFADIFTWHLIWDGL